MTAHSEITYAVPCYVFMTRTYDWTSGLTKEIWGPAIYSFKPDNSASSVFVKEISVNVTVPQDWSPVLSQIAALDELEKKTAKEYLKTIERITQERNKLLALTLSPTTGEVA